MKTINAKIQVCWDFISGFLFATALVASLTAMIFFACNFNNLTFEENVQLPLVLVANDTLIRLHGTLPGLSDTK